MKLGVLVLRPQDGPQERHSLLLDGEFTRCDHIARGDVQYEPDHKADAREPRESQSAAAPRPRTRDNRADQAQRGGARPKPWDARPSDGQ